MKRPLCVVCLAVVVCVALRIWLYPPPTADYGDACGRQVTLIGQVYAKEFQKGVEAPVLLLYVAPSALYFQNQEIPYYDNFICRMQPDGLQPAIGSSVAVSGVLSVFEPATNPGQFDSRLYYATIGFSARIDRATVIREEAVVFDLREMLWQFRCRLSEGLDAVFGKEDAAILKAMLLGDKSGLPSDIKEIYKESGIMHILAISGLHIAVLGIGLESVLCKLRVPRMIGSVLCGVVMILYGIMVGMPVSAFRAVFMFLLRLLADRTGRTYDAITALVLSAVFLLIQQPLYLLNAGFLLSFLAVAAILLLKPRLLPPLSERLSTKGPLFEESLPHRLDALTTSLSILFFSLPVQLSFYYETTVYAPLFNLLVLPFVGALLAAGVGALALWWLLPFIPFLTNVLALFVHWILLAYERGGETVRNMAGAILTAGCPRIWQLICYEVLLVTVVFLKKLVWRYRMGLLCGAFLILTVPVHRGFTVTMLDVGQGQCICMRLPDGTTWLYDGGSLDVGSVGEYRMEPYLKSQGVSRADAVFLSHGDADHISGVLEMLEDGDIEIGMLVLPITEKACAYTAEGEFSELVLLAELREIPVLWFEAGMAWENAGVSVQCLHPRRQEGYEDDGTESNADSMVLYVTYNDFSMLLTGDVEEEGEEALLATLQKNNIGQVTVLQVAHHGSKYSSSAQFLEQISPQVALISCGEKNSYGHPHEETLFRLEEVGSIVLTTPKCGAIEVIFGQEMEIRCWK